MAVIMEVALLSLIMVDTENAVHSSVMVTMTFSGDVVVRRAST